MTSFLPWALMPAIATSTGECQPPVNFEKKNPPFFLLLTKSGEIKAISTAKITATHTTISAPFAPASVT